jgi:general secretion pathway protein N
LSQFDQIAARPLFSDDRRPKPFSLQGDGGADAAKAFDFVLSSVLITPQLKLAILQSPDRSKSLRVKLGESPEAQPSWRLTELTPRGAVFEGPEGRRAMELRTFDGTGGEPPTAITQPGATPVGQSVRPTPQPQPQPPSASAAQRAAAAPTNGAERPGPQGPAVVAEPAGNAQQQQQQTSEQQMEAIRKRIEARRAQLRQQQQQQQKQQPQSPAKNQ